MDLRSNSLYFASGLCKKPPKKQCSGAIIGSRVGKMLTLREGAVVDVPSGARAPPLARPEPAAAWGGRQTLTGLTAGFGDLLEEETRT